MNAASLACLLLLSAIWGASFPFMRVAVPVLGPGLLIFLRVFLAAMFLLAVAQMLRRPLQVRQNWRNYLFLGCFNSALPFFLYAYAAKTAPVSLLAVLNATAPIWGAVLTTAWSRTIPTGRVMLGLLLGISGVGLLAGVESFTLPADGRLAIAAALGAALSYSIASMYARSAPSVEPMANAHGCMWVATLLMLPGLWLAPLPTVWPAWQVLASVVGLGVLCSGVAYLLYFRLIADVGATSALTVTFLIPVFGIALGALFLGEPVGWHTIAGSAIVLAGTALVTGFSPRALLGRRQTG